MPKITPAKITFLLSISSFIAFTAIAVALRPNYDFATQFLSELGIGNGADWFNAGLAISGAGIALFFLQLKKPFAMSATGIACGLALVGVGIFPMSSGLMHAAMTGLFFALGAAALLIFALRVSKNQLASGIALLVVAAAILHMLLRDPISQKIAVVLFIAGLGAIAMQEK